MEESWRERVKRNGKLLQNHDWTETHVQHELGNKQDKYMDTDIIQNKGAPILDNSATRLQE